MAAGTDGGMAERKSVELYVFYRFLKFAIVRDKYLYLQVSLAQFVRACFLSFCCITEVR